MNYITPMEEGQQPVAKVARVSLAALARAACNSEMNPCRRTSPPVSQRIPTLRGSSHDFLVVFNQIPALVITGQEKEILTELLGSTFKVRR